MQQLVEMGFSRNRAEYALKELADEEEPRAELVVAWLIDHPDIEVGVTLNQTASYPPPPPKKKRYRFYKCLGIKWWSNYVREARGNS